MFQSIRLKLFFITSIAFFTATAQQKIVLHIDENKLHQTIQNFAASDAWSCQFVGNWPDEKKNIMADWLFSMDTLSNGNPRGIGLSLWRYNLGAGSAEQGYESGIKDEWRRAALTLGNAEPKNRKVEAQNWFLLAAKKRGVQQFLGFFNSPPMQLTKSKRAFANQGDYNIDSNNYKAFADYAVKAIQEIKSATGIIFNFISPVNEPQWDWSDGGQEGCPYTNAQIGSLIKVFSKSFQQNKLNTKLLVTESGDLKYLLPAANKKDKDEQVHDFFNASSPYYIGNLPNVSRVIAAHSYFTTSPFTKGMELRKQVKDSIAKIKGLVYWQSEYCILGDNEGEIKGEKRDTGISAALYVAKVIHEDLVGADAAAWQWWTAISAYDYKDGLIYIDKRENGGDFSDSKMLWAMGNYSRFIRPGMQRIDVDINSRDLLVSGYKDVRKGRLVLVFVNESVQDKLVITGQAGALLNKRIVIYTTDATRSLAKNNAVLSELLIPARSIVTVVID
jgi:hypothetical protein